MKVLLTNDDGIYAEGIKELALAFSKSGNEVVMVAPERERSATGHAITVHKPLRVKEFNIEGVKSFSVSGTPADCVKIAIEALLEKPDMVISGINRGANLGTDVLYSGTVSAAIEAALDGLPSIAISMACYKDPLYNTGARFAVDLAEKYINNGLPEGTLLNVNVPNIKTDELKGVQVTKLGERKYNNNFEKRVDPRGGTYYWMAGKVDESDPQPETDVWAVVNNYISITPIHFDLTNHFFLQELKKWQLK